MPGLPGREPVPGGPCSPLVRSAGRAVIALLALLDRVAADDLGEHAVTLIEQSELALLEFAEELVPGDLDQAVVLRLGIVREHDADDPDVAALVRTVHGGRLAALALGPFADGLVVRGDFGHSRALVRHEIAESTPCRDLGSRAAHRAARPRREASSAYRPRRARPLTGAQPCPGS